MNYFPLGRSCRQGDPLSPYLFILALDPLIRKIERDNSLHGIRLVGGTTKVEAYADDMTCMLRDEAEVQKALEIVTEFGGFSGLEINKEKSEILTMGTWRDLNHTGLKSIDTLKITGVHFGRRPSCPKAELLNFGNLEDKIKGKLGQWAGRDLTVIGKMIAAKAQGQQSRSSSWRRPPVSQTNT